ncbi:sigma-54 interaction domain-containing protein [Lactonifactor longoviformis]|uniref:sigma-54 interaction domain-containing protein n=1 Tax=Lactonifactor longoviformis TaxID=341220 RepID=UPI0036F3B4FF
MIGYKELILETGICFDVFDQMQDEILFFDVNANLVYLNQSAERSEGYTLKESYGRSLFELYDFQNDVRKDTSPAYIALTEKRPVRDMICVYYTGGLKKTKTIDSTPIYKGGKLIGAFNIQRDLTQLSNMIDENLELQSKINRHRSCQNGRDAAPFADLIGSSETFRYSLTLARKAAKTDSSVLLIGEDGCGKNTFARSIHESSSRSDGPFLSINCASIPENLLEGLLFGTQNKHYPGPDSEGILRQASGGTLYLENVTYLSPGIQMKLLHVLEEHMFIRPNGSEAIPVNIRIICSSSEPPAEMIRNNRLRMEFFYCISVVQIPIPSLAERTEDIPLLTNYFISEFNRRFHKRIQGVDSEVMSWFRIYHWPGNIRQFRSCIEAAMNLTEDGHEIHADDLPANVFYETRTPRTHFNSSDEPSGALTGGGAGSGAVKQDTYFSKRKLYLEAQEKEQEEIIKALKQTNGNISQAARILGISRQLMHYRMKKYHIE